MISGDAECISSGEFGEVGALVSPAIDRPAQRRFKSAFITNPWRTAEKSKLTIVNGFDELRCEPNRSVLQMRHLASSVSALR